MKGDRAIQRERIQLLIISKYHLALWGFNAILHSLLSSLRIFYFLLLLFLLVTSKKLVVGGAEWSFMTLMGQSRRSFLRSKQRTNHNASGLCAVGRAAWQCIQESLKSCFFDPISPVLGILIYECKSFGKI